MVRCDECHVAYRGALDRCPLCGHTLKGEPSPAAFPVYQVQKTAKLGKRLLAAIFLCSIAATVIGGATLGASALSIAAMCATIGIAYLFVRNLMLHSPDTLRVTERYFLVVVAACALWFISSGNAAAATYVIPFVCLAGVLFNTVLLVIQRSAFVAGYAKYLLYNVAMGLAPLILVAIGATTTAVPSAVSAVAAIVLAILLGLLTRRQSMEEARKLFSA